SFTAAAAAAARREHRDHEHREERDGHEATHPVLWPTLKHVAHCRPSSKSAQPFSSQRRNRVLHATLPAIATPLFRCGSRAARVATVVAMVLATAALVTAFEADAQAPAPSATAGDTGSAAFGEEFARADKNKDGHLSEDEARDAGFFTRESFK